MGSVLIRNVDDGALKKLSSMSKKKGMSREEFLRVQIESMAISGDVKAIENRYESLVMSLMQKLEEMNEVIERNNLLMQDNMDMLNELENRHGK